MGTKEKKHTIENKTYTANELAKELNCTVESARNRLKTHKTLKELYKPIKKGGGGSLKKEYTFGDTVLTVDDVMVKLNCSTATARTRLRRATTLEEIYTTPVKNISKNPNWKSGNPHNRKQTNMDDKLNKLLYGKW